MKVTLLMALTVDGKIAKSHDHFPDWTGKADKRLFAKISRKAGVVIMGSKTFDTIGTPLADRQNIVLTRNPARRSRWPNLKFTRQTPPELIAALTHQGYTHAILAGGALINSLFAKAHLIDDIMLTISPKIFGQGLSLFSEPVALDLDLLDVQKLGTDRIFLHYRVLP